ncbi:hypothetical protein SAMN05216529_103346 [Faecalicatena contorta]|uniref:Uncharacterized protein n=1 Tax=Faecalicatena contorta TaxID=39482 RepID=A0A315ZZF5_9FIRM|nr:hypothetical protein A8805_103346 [Faecalicatena contorta]SUQ13614.1 hypothetical protein SAMN05216529_103346 [Faecalicatena contorta]
MTIQKPDKNAGKEKHDERKWDIITGFFAAF